VLVIQPMSETAMELFSARPDIRVEVLSDTSPSAIAASVTDADAITIRDAMLLASALEHARKLRIVSRHGVGYDNVPVQFCTERGVPVTVVGDLISTSSPSTRSS
jgi:D-3-phosphoglycerate dehydrogenase